MNKPAKPWNYWTPTEEHLIDVKGGDATFDRVQELSNAIYGRCILCPRLMLFEYNSPEPIGRLVMLCPDCRKRFYENAYRKN